MQEHFILCDIFFLQITTISAAEASPQASMAFGGWGLFVFRPTPDCDTIELHLFGMSLSDTFFQKKKIFLNFIVIIAITDYPPSCLDQETAKRPFGLQEFKPCNKIQVVRLLLLALYLCRF